MSPVPDSCPFCEGDCPQFLVHQLEDICCPEYLKLHLENTYKLHSKPCQTSKSTHNWKRFIKNLIN